MARLSRITSFSFVAGLALGGACHGGKPRPAADPDAVATVLFTNESLDQADVFAVPGGGTRVRLGAVLPGRTETFTLDRSALGGTGSLVIVARLLARSNMPDTGPLTLIGGQRIAVRLSSDARTLSVLPAP